MRKVIRQQANGRYLVLIRTKHNILFSLADIPTREEADVRASRELAQILKRRKEGRIRKRRRGKANAQIIFCAGGCGRSQKARAATFARVRDWAAVGCGKCPGWAALCAQPVPKGYIRDMQYHVVGEFRGFRHLLATMKDQARPAQARVLTTAASESEFELRSEIGLAERALTALRRLNVDSTNTGATPDSKYHTGNGLRSRGWTPAVIQRFMPEPDKCVRNPHYASAGKMRLYARDRVYELEKGEAVRQALLAVRMRRDKRLRRLTVLMHAANQAPPVGLLSPSTMICPESDSLSTLECVENIVRRCTIYDARWEDWVREGGVPLLMLFLGKVLEAVKAKYPSLEDDCAVLQKGVFERLEYVLKT